MFDLPPPDPGIEFFIASQGMSKGLRQAGGAQVVPKAFVQFGKVQVGGQWKNVTSSTAKGEGALFVNGVRLLGTAQLSLGAIYKFQIGVSGNINGKAIELTAGLSGKVQGLGLRLNSVYSPDDFGQTGASLYLEGGPSYDLDPTTRISASLGRRERVGSPDYSSFNAGLSKTLFKKMTVDFRYYDTAQSDLGDLYWRRVVASARLAF
jgi:hypothetical protein